jgi:hypothetical protein
MTFDHIQQTTVQIRLGALSCFRGGIHTDKLTSLVTDVVWHQVTMVLYCPSTGTNIAGRDHHVTWTWFGMAYGANRLMVMKIVREKWRVCIHFVFNSVYVRVTLVSIYGFTVDWIEWHAKVVWSSTSMSIVRTSHYTWNKKAQYTWWIRQAEVIPTTKVQLPP